MGGCQWARALWGGLTAWGTQQNRFFSFSRCPQLLQCRWPTEQSFGLHHFGSTYLTRAYQGLL